MDLEKKYSIIKYTSYNYNNKKKYSAEESKEFFDEELCKKLYEKINENTNSLHDLLNHFDFSLVFSNSAGGLSLLQWQLLTYLILKNVDNLNIITTMIGNSIQTFMDQLYESNASNDSIVFKIVNSLDSEKANRFIVNHFESFSNKQILFCYEQFAERQKNENYKKLILCHERAKSLFITRVSAPFFYEQVEDLELGSEFIERRKEHLKTILNNPIDYNNDTIKEALCDYYFEEKYINIMNDLKTIVNAMNSFKINEEMRELFNLINNNYLFLKNIDLKSEEEIRNFVNSFSLNKLILEKTYSYVETLFRNNLSESINKDFSKVHTEKVRSSFDKDVIIYNFDNSTSDQNEFEMLISTIPASENAKEFTNIFLGDKNGELRHQRRSCSLIDQSSLNKTFGRKGRIIFGYCDLSNRKITSATLCDGQTDGNEKRYGKKRKTRRCNFINTKEFLEQTYGHNEISIEYDNTSEYQIIKPSYILVIGRKPSQVEIDIAAILNIPIRNIDIFKYEQKESNMKSNIEEQYDYISFEKETPVYRKKEDIKTM